ncbi:MAG: winged helix DNA-binding protein [Prevotellaceae bacterium]|jgi:DNA-binding MarR family transcriptional regulator|nr:winged helix DNA-binding protein [Prevotellaceae bacterium]
MENLCKIRDIYRSIIEFENHFQSQYNLGLNEGMLLCAVNKSQRCSSSEIASMLGLTCSNTSKVIASAEKKGLLKRILGDSDKRQMYFTLTKKGNELLESMQNCKFRIPELLKVILETAEFTYT